MLSAKKQMEISLVCHATVGNWMASMCNPKNRGSAFTWDKFPAMMEKQCRDQFLSVPMSERLRDRCLEHAEQTGRAIAENWVKKMTE
jgi:hypothetical protein